ncbi:MAG: hypothetical protein IJG18_00485 [Kiritimatiellae bacterium]|nr:hypothetical protein [Kiritimatiellia bacterium]
MKASTIAILFAAIPALAFAETPDRFVRYVESTGSQYVDTGVTGRWNTRVEAQVEWLEFKDSSLIGSRTSSSTGSRLYFCYCLNVDGNMYTTTYGGGVEVTWNGDWKARWEKNRIYDYVSEFSATNGESQTTNTIKVDGLTVWSKTGNCLDTGKTLHLFACNVGGTASYKSKARIYRLKIWQGPKDGGDMTLVRDLMPCVKDDRAGLYDTVSGNILYSGSGTDLECDEDSEKPDEFVDYVESTGCGYIDTEINAQSGTSAEIDLAVLTTRARNKSVLGAYTADGDKRFYLLYCNTGVMRVGYGALSGEDATIYSVGTRYLVESSLSSGTQTLERTNIDESGEKKTLYTGTNSAEVDLEMPLYLFACNKDGTADWAGQYRLYGCKIRQGGALVRDFKPCLKDGEFALYDDVSKRIFHMRRGFLNGPVQAKEAKAKNLVFVDYIESSGWETLDTGVRARAGTRAKGEFAYTYDEGVRWEKYRYLREPVNPTEHRVYLGADNPDEWPTYFFPVSCKSQSESDNYRWLYGDYGSDSSAHGAYAHTDGSTKIQMVSEAKHSFDASLMKGAQTIELDGTNVWSLSNDANFDTGKNLHIFSSGSRYRSAARCYGLEIWQDGEKVRDFKPCIYDDKAALYDTVTESVYLPSPYIPSTKAVGIKLSGEEKPAYYVDYVESDGTIFVDTGVTGKSGTKGEFKMQFKEKGDLGFLETWNSSASTSPYDMRRFYLWHNYLSQNVFCIGYGKFQSFSSSRAISTDYTVSSSLCTGALSVTVNGTTWTQSDFTAVDASATIDSGLNLHLFAQNKDGSPASAGKARLYYLKLYQGNVDGSNMQLVRNFKPVQLSNGLVALWDFKNKKAYLPQLVSSPGTYTQFPVVGSTGDKINAGTVILIR